MGLKKAWKDFFGQSDSTDKTEDKSSSTRAPALKLVMSGNDLSSEEKHNSKADEAKIELSPAGSEKVKYIDDAYGLPYFTKNLYLELNMASTLHHRICPIQLEETTTDGKKQFALIVQEMDIQSDLVSAISSRLAELHFMPARTLIYVVPFSVMLELSRNRIKEKARKVNKGFYTKPDSALWEQFQEACKFAVTMKASDMHFEIFLNKPYSRIRFRISGILIAPKAFNVATTELLDCISHVYNNHGQSVSQSLFDQNKEQNCDISCTVANTSLRLRYASQPNSQGLDVVIRVLVKDNSGKVKTHKELGYLPDQIKLWALTLMKRSGATFIAGRVGSGKTTVLQTNIRMMGDNKKIITIEDPVEYELPNASQISVPRDMADEDNDPYVPVKRQFKRLDPDIGFPGEIRDFLSAQLVEEIVKAGFHGMTTIHSDSITNLLTLRLPSNEFGISRDVIASPNFINLLVYQALLRTLCTCKIPATEVYDDEYLTRIEMVFDIRRERIMAANPKGCGCCRNEIFGEDMPLFNGYGDRIAVAEMLRPDYHMLMLLREQKNLEIAQYFRQMRTARFDEEGTMGKTALEVAMYHVSQGNIDPKEVERELGSFEEYWLKEQEMARVN